MKKKLALAVVLMSGLLLTACNNQNSTTQAGSSFTAGSLRADPNLTAQDYKLYSDFLAQSKGQRGTTFVIKQWIDPLKGSSAATSEVKASFERILGTKVDSATVESLVSRNLYTGPIESRFDRAVNVNLMSRSDYSVMFDQPNPWRKFYSRFPNATGLMSLSRPGYNKNASQALIAYTLLEGSQGGASYLVLLNRTGNNWRIQRSQTTMNIKPGR